MDHPILAHQDLDLIQEVEKAMIIQNRASLQQVDHLKRVSLTKNIPEYPFSQACSKPIFKAKSSACKPSPWP
ncbi:HAMP domain-containing protein [Sesbania bispinosa]|nr:HAMP domain-containing protein [Sesbania bispinosa]